MAGSTTAALVLMGDSSQKTGQDLPEAYWELVARYREKLHLQAMHILGRQEDAEDVVQETFVEVLRDTAKLNQVRSIGAWLHTVNRAHALNRLQARRREAQNIDTGRKAVTTGGFSVLELRDSISKAVEELPDKQRDVIRLRFYEHLPFDQIAQRLAMPEGTAKWLACEAMVKLHASLRAYLPDMEGHGPAAGAESAPEGKQA
ncbi:MAG: sigma-70 family RNA polymerase sigma factor [Planctomycetes bacterium]|nr:sigma-70 family RNA polymerase sigma factor [Planctomycetota bacterium]